MSDKKIKVAIVGGGVAGVSSALYLSYLGLEVTLFEKQSSFVNGPPFCHLHAGGNLYRDIPDEDCITLLKQSIDFVNFYPFVIDYRPTVIAIPTSDQNTPQALLPRLKLLEKTYQQLIEEDSLNCVLGESQNYYKTYSKERMIELQQKNTPKNPKTADEWMVSVAQNIDLKTIKFPLILVQEYGLNLFRLASGASLALQKEKNVTLALNTTVKNLYSKNKKWHITSIDKKNIEKIESFDYLINSAGFQTGKIDDMLDIPCKRMVEFKSAYISFSQAYEKITFPEIIFHGERGTPQGMGQFTPYPHGFFQLHSMTHQSTLYKDGLVSNTKFSCQPQLKKNFIEKIEKSWNKEEIQERTQSAISHLSHFIPKFKKATVASKPLFGVQQILGDDPSLRVAEVSFPLKQYARCEIIKVSSVLDMLHAIVKDLKKLNFLSHALSTPKNLPSLLSLKEEEISSYAKKLSVQREYPEALASLTTPKSLKFYQPTVFKNYPQIIALRTQKNTAYPYDFSLALHTNQPKDAILSNRKQLSLTLEQNTPFYYIVANQTHGNRVKVITKKESKGWLKEESAIENCDALITNIPHIMLTILTADCVPILMYDKKEKVVSIIHAGWRGTQKNIVQKTIQKMQEVYDTNPQDIIAFIAPSIRKCCYEVTKEVAKHFLHMPQTLIQKKDKYRLDLATVNKNHLLESGVKEKNIEISSLCTSCEVETLFSYRKEKGCSGRFMNIIGLK